MAEPAARVLVVDDERFFREAIRDALAGAGYACRLAEDGRQALEMAADPALGVVVLDIQMPGLDGLEVMRRLRESRPELRVIILSAHTEQEYVLEALRLGASDYLAKPLHEEELVLAVRRALEGFALAAGFERLRGRLRALPEAIARLRAEAARAQASERAARVREGAAQAAAELLDAARTSVMLLDPDAPVLRVAAAVGGVPAAQREPVPVGEGAAGRAFARGEPLLVRGTAPGPGARYAASSYALVPIGEGEARRGVLCATERRGGELDEDDLGLLRVLAQELVGLLGPAGTEGTAAAAPPSAPAGEAEALDPDVELARAICAATTAEVAPERILGAALAAASAALGGAPASLHLLDPESANLRTEAEHSGLRPERAVLPRGRGLTGVALETGCPVSSAEPEADPRFDPEVDTPGDAEPGPFVCVPITFRGRPLGVFRAFPADPARVSARTAELLAASLSAAVRNVLLYRSLLESIEEVARVRRDARRGR
jgi:DNA-binding response OmpR family regulator